MTSRLLPQTISQTRRYLSTPPPRSTPTFSAYMSSPNSGLHLTVSSSSPLAKNQLFDWFTPSTEQLASFPPLGEYGTLLDYVEGLRQSSSSQDLLSLEMIKLIDIYYEEHAKIVGMGENDPGVTFAGIIGDPLNAGEDIEKIVKSVKETRHGVRFYAKTSGLILSIEDVRNGILKSKFGLKGVEVFLPAANPPAFAKQVGELSNGMKHGEAFGRVCEFISTSAESGIEVRVAVRKGDKESAALGRGLGAVDVNEY